MTLQCLHSASFPVFSPFLAYRLTPPSIFPPCPSTLLWHWSHIFSLGTDSDAWTSADPIAVLFFFSFSNQVLAPLLLEIIFLCIRQHKAETILHFDTQSYFQLVQILIMLYLTANNKWLLTEKCPKRSLAGTRGTLAFKQFLSVYWLSSHCSRMFLTCIIMPLND